MKKLIFYFFILFVLCLSGCKSIEKNSQIYEYFPFKENALYEYEGEGSVFASYKIYNTFINGNRMQQRIDPEVESYDRQTQVFEVNNGELRLINGDTFYYHYEDQTQNPPGKDMLLLKEPLKLGAKWVISPGDNAEITGVDVDITTPIGSFKALEVTSVFANGFSQKDYYVKNIGLVQTSYITAKSDIPITSSLAKYTENTGIKCEYKSYYPIFGSDEVSVYVDELELWTNYDFIDLVNSIIYKSSPDGTHNALVSKGKIMELVFAANTSAILVNFDKDIYDQGYTSENDEYSNLSSIAITLGKLLGVQQVFLQVDGKPYSGLYVKLNEDNAFTVNQE